MVLGRPLPGLIRSNLATAGLAHRATFRERRLDREFRVSRTVLAAQTEAGKQWPRSRQLHAGTREGHWPPDPVEANHFPGSSSRRADPRAEWKIFDMGQTHLGPRSDRHRSLRGPGHKEKRLASEEAASLSCPLRPSVPSPVACREASPNTKRRQPTLKRSQHGSNEDVSEVRSP